MPGGVLRVVLALAVREILGRAQDRRPHGGCLLVVCGGVRNTDEHVRRRRLVALYDDDGAVLVDELRTVVADLQALAEAERSGQSVDCLANVAVGKLGDDDGLGD